LHALKDGRSGQHAISINDQWRICLRFVDRDGYDAEVCDYHQAEDDMTIPITRLMSGRPTHPGETLREDSLPDCGLSVASLREAAGVSRQSANELRRGRRAVCPEMALRLSRLFGNTAEFGMNAQQAVDVWDAMQTAKDEDARLTPLRGA